MLILGTRGTVSTWWLLASRECSLAQHLRSSHMVHCSWVDLALSSSNFEISGAKVLRVARVFRPLRTLSHLPGKNRPAVFRWCLVSCVVSACAALGKIVDTIFRSLQGLQDAAFLLFFVLFAFALAGVQVAAACASPAHVRGPNMHECGMRCGSDASILVW